MLFISITAALIEEFGRYIAFHFVTRDCTVNNIPLYYGFGHGGIEALSVGINNIFLILFSSDYLASTGASVALAGRAYLYSNCSNCILVYCFLRFWELRFPSISFYFG